MANCNVTLFENQHGGLQELTPIQGTDRFRVFRDNFKALVSKLKLPRPHRASMVPELFEKQGYYIGKAQLKCLLDQDFADYDGVQITLGLDKSIDGRDAGRLVLLIKGAFRTGSGGQEFKEIGGERVDVAHYQESELTFVAAMPLIDTTPAPNSMPIPPYGKG